MAKKVRRPRHRPTKLYYKEKFIPSKKNVGYAWRGTTTNLCTGVETTRNQSIIGPLYNGTAKRSSYWVSNKKPYHMNLPCKRLSSDTMWFDYPAVSVSTNVSSTRCPAGNYVKNYNTDYRSNIFGHVSAYGFTNDEPLIATLPNVSSCHFEALEFFGSLCTPLDINLAVNLAELGDTLSLIKDAGIALLNLKKFYPKVRKYFRDWKAFIHYLTSGQTGNYAQFLKEKDLSGEAANLYLMWSFAIAPLIGDISKWSDTLQKVEDHVDWIIANSKKPTPIRFNKDVTDLGPAIQNVSYPAVPSTSSASGTQLFTTFYEAHYCAYATAYFDASSIKRDKLLREFRKKALGFLDPGIFLWELIPFSFVIDWFVNASQLIKKYTSVPPLPVKLTNVGHWVKVTHVHTRTMYYYNPSNATPRELMKQIVYVSTMESFERRTELPLKFSGIDFSIPGIKQALLGLSLGRQALS